VHFMATLRSFVPRCKSATLRVDITYVLGSRRTRTWVMKVNICPTKSDWAALLLKHRLDSASTWPQLATNPFLHIR
jgi:hypothetical protein